MASNRAQHLTTARKLSISSPVAALRLPSHANHQRFKSPEGQQMVADGCASRRVHGSYERLPSGARRGVIRETATSRDERAPGPLGMNAVAPFSMRCREPYVARRPALKHRLSCPLAVPQSPH